MSTTNPFVKATKAACYLRLALVGPAGSGKTYTALRLATVLGKRVAIVDTEHGSASKYADLFAFDSMELEPPFHPKRYTDAISAAVEAGYDVLIVDSASHAWTGEGGLLEQVDKIASRSASKNKFQAWNEGTQIQTAFVESMLGARLHLIVTMRSKTEYVIEENERGKKTPRKVGMAPVQRDGVEYEFDVVGEMDQENTLVVTKTRCPALAKAVIREPDEKMARTLLAWLGDGERTITSARRQDTPTPDEPPPAEQPQADPPQARPRTGNGRTKGTAQQRASKAVAALGAFGATQEDLERWLAGFDAPPLPLAEWGESEISELEGLYRNLNKLGPRERMCAVRETFGLPSSAVEG